MGEECIRRAALVGLVTSRDPRSQWTCVALQEERRRTELGGRGQGVENGGERRRSPPGDLPAGVGCVR